MNLPIVQPVARALRPRIVLAAADATLRARLRILLEANEYQVDAVASGTLAADVLAVTAPDIVVFAPASGDDDIASLCQATEAPVVVLIAAAGDARMVEALDADAADALAPPYPRGELLARLRLALRRSRKTPPRPEHSFGELKLDVASRELRVAGNRVTLTRLEYRVLEELILAGGHAVAHQDLLGRIWGPAHRNRLNYLRVYIARLRAKIELHGAAPRLIVSVPGVGYRLASGGS